MAGEPEHAKHQHRRAALGKADALINNVARQVQERARHLPRGMQQNIKIDVRGQNVSSGHLDDIARRIVEKSNGLLSRKHIEFMEFY